MFLRFAAAIGLATAIGLMAIAIEKQNLSLKRAISLQHYQLELLREQRCRLVLQTQHLGAPPRLLDAWKKEYAHSEPTAKTATGSTARKAVRQ